MSKYPSLDCDIGLDRVREIPHECSDPDCPGNETRRKLEAYDGLLNVCERFYAELSAASKPTHPGETVFLDGVAGILLTDAYVAIAKAKE